jgi:hypothetical protein
VHLQRTHSRYHHRAVRLELAEMHSRPTQRPAPVDNELRRPMATTERRLRPS